MNTYSDISGFDSLRWDDQEKIKGKVGGGGGKGSEPAAVSGGSDDLIVEYAKSSRSKCKNCKDQIDKVRLYSILFLYLTSKVTKAFRGLIFVKIIRIITFPCQGELRLAKVMEPDADSNAPAGVPIPWWHHVDCFIENSTSLGVESTVTAESFSGFTKLKKEDKDLLKSKLGSGVGKKAGKGGKRKAQAVDEVDAKRKKTAEEDEIEKQLKVCLL